VLDRDLLRGSTILVVEDDRDTLELFATSLVRIGAEVRMAASALAANALLAEWRPDAVLCDLHLPGVDGYSLLDTIRANPTLRDLPVIAISGSHPAIERARSENAGFTSYLVKPARLSEMVETILGCITHGDELMSIEELGKQPQRADVIAESAALIDAQVKQKGFFVRSAYATIKALKSGIVPDVVDSLLDDWLAKLQPHHDAWAATKTGTFADYLAGRADRVAEDLLAVTDARAAKTSKATAKKLYGKLRPSAKDNVVAAMPELARMLERRLVASSTAA
jgi:CheY-like chemotaxis protein